MNIAELLKDCPSGMELDCTLFEGLEFDSIVDNDFLPIRCRIENSGGGYNVYNFTKYGCWVDMPFAKCVIFPKGKTTWEGFAPPCKFKDRDIVATNSGLQVLILQRAQRNTKGYCYIGYDFKFNEFFDAGVWEFDRLATEEEKQKLFDAIKANGYKWNPETKTLEKLPKFKVGDWVEFKYYERKPAKIIRIENNVYYLSSGDTLMFQDEHAWDLTTNKFDITTLKVFDKVLVRNHNAQEWVASLFSNYNEPKKYKYICVNSSGYAQCIPYEGNEHLLGTKNDCDDFYKTWE